MYHWKLRILSSTLALLTLALRPANVVGNATDPIDGVSPTVLSRIKEVWDRHYPRKRPPIEVLKGMDWTEIVLCRLSRNWSILLPDTLSQGSGLSNSD